MLITPRKQASWTPVHRFGKIRHNFIRQFRRYGLWNAVVSFCRQSFSRVTGIPVLSGGRITPLVYVGPQHGQLGKWRLELAGIKHMVNMRMEFNDADHNLALKSYRHLPSEDKHSPTLEQLESGIAFIQQAVDQQEKVYIHCKHGRGRAPTLAAAFLISRGLTVLDAVNLVHQARQCTRFTATQRAQLGAFYAATRRRFPNSVVQKPPLAA